MSTANVARLSVAAMSRQVSGESGLRARDVMRAPAAVAPDTPITAAATMLAAAGWAGAPVVCEDQVVGVVTEADLVAHHVRGRADEVTVGAVMTSDPLLAPGRYDVGRLVGLMLASGATVVPIVDAGRLVGTVDMRDLLRLVGGVGAEAAPARQASG